MDDVRKRWRAIDPLSYAEWARSKPMYLVNTRFDRMIPRESTERPWEALRRPRSTGCRLATTPRASYGAGFYVGATLSSAMLWTSRGSGGGPCEDSGKSGRRVAFMSHLGQ